MLSRNITVKLNKYLELFPVVAIIGPRQSGKTTFVQMELKNWKYFDLENKRDFDRIDSDIGFFLEEYGSQCIIDEAQTMPELFSAIRSHIDKNRNKNGQLVLLGSINPLLIKNIAESLAGRIGFIELTPFMYSEITRRKINTERFWLHGGFPELWAWKEEERFIWIENYLKTFVERDINKLIKSKLSPQKILSLLQLIAHNHGRLWNASQNAAAFGLSYHTINEYVELLEKFFLIRKLTPYHVNIKKRLVKSPKYYYSDTGLLHYLLGINTIETLRASPFRGFSFEGFVIEQIIHKYSLDLTKNYQFYFYRTAQGDEIDLIVKSGTKLVAYEIKTSTTINISDLKGFKKSLEQLSISKGTVIYSGKNSYMLNSQIDVVSLVDLVKMDI